MSRTLRSYYKYTISEINLMKNYKILYDNRMRKRDKLIKNINNPYPKLMMNIAKNIRIYLLDLVRQCQT